jgi:hypothetical protein
MELINFLSILSLLLDSIQIENNLNELTNHQQHNNE